MLTYHDVMTTDLSLLTTAADQWETAAKKFEAVRKIYDGQVKSVGTDGSWNGLSAVSAGSAMAETSAQFAAAPKEARAIASLLRDAHAQFVDLRGKVKSAVADAKKHGFEVNEHGVARYAKDDEAARHDPDLPRIEASWTRRVDDAVRAVDDADQGVKLALRKAVENPDTRFGAPAGFNAGAVGDIEKVEAQEAAELATKLNSTGYLDAKELAEMQRLFRDNEHDKAFSQTFLAGLGPQGAVKFTNKLDDLVGSDKKHQQDYLKVRDGLATSLATATRVPTFKGTNGKALRFGSKEYSRAYTEWLGSSGGSFYKNWREGLKKAGVAQYDRDSVTHKANSLGRYHGQQVRGYQSLITLMKHGDGYSTQFLSDLGDDIRAAEDKKQGGDPDIWDLYGKFGDKADRGFVQDPMDGLLGIMSHDPAASAAYLDPNSDPNPADGKSERNDRLHYLVKDRDWNITKATSWQGNIEHTIADVAPEGGHKGFTAALQAAATGRLPESAAGAHPYSHSAANAAVMHETVKIFGDDPALIKKDGAFADIRGNLGKMTADYMGDVQRAMYSSDHLPIHGSSAHLGSSSVKLEPFLDAVGRDPHAYGAITAAQQTYTGNLVNDVINGHSTSQVSLEQRVQNAVAPGGVIAGIMSEGRAEGIHEEHIVGDAEFNERAGLASKWVNRFVGYGLGAGLEKLPGAAPFAAPIGWIQEDINESIMASIKQDTTDAARDQAGYNFANGRAAIIDSSRYAVQHAAEHAHMDTETIEDLKRAAATQAGNSHGEGSNWQQARNGTHS
ncbi:DUF6571 family protein [Streptomyces sp. NPDC050617]|uniref:DUF6571 family protein n=1 Tax=Streptomyces sp. NPDC050617 TaxID=3154628 RepID=UPI003423BAF8